MPGAPWSILMLPRRPCQDLRGRMDARRGSADLKTFKERPALRDSIVNAQMHDNEGRVSGPETGLSRGAAPLTRNSGAARHWSAITSFDRRKP
jgi:hypothetical protein